MAETDYPLLVFPEPVRADRAKLGGGGGNLRIPNVSRQAERLAPQLQRLQEALDQKRVALQDNPLGLQPEQVLVLETIGSITDFIKAVGKISGLEWLGEYELDGISPEYGFQDKKTPDKLLRGQLFLVMTDQRALREMFRLFKKWKKNPKLKFPAGMAPLKHAFARLHTIRPWGAEDRIRETGVLEDWQYRMQSDQNVVPFEAELWFRSDAKRRQVAETQLRTLIESMGGKVIQQCVISDIAYHAILARIHRSHIQDIIEQPAAFQTIKLLQCEEIMHLRPVGQCSIPIFQDTSEAEGVPHGTQAGLPRDDPIVALFDGIPLAGHQLLKNRLIIDDPDGYETAYQAHERRHGTAMASLICHGDLNESDYSLRTPLYVRPIMQPLRGFNNQFHEAIPEDVLPIDLIHRAVRRLFESENGTIPSAPTIRIINLSICDASRPLYLQMSSWARLLDWLSWKYQILFIVSAGNHYQDLELDVPRSQLSSLSRDGLEIAVVKALAADTRNRRLLSPAETLNGITIGAIHKDASVSSPNLLIDPFVGSSLPSVYSAQGPGYRRAIKPDLQLAGGRQLLSEKLGTAHRNATLQNRPSFRPPGQCVAAPGSSGQLDETVHTRGTSGATALASRGASHFFDLIGQLRLQPDKFVPSDFDVALVKAMLVHGADWADAKTRYEAALKNSTNSRTFKEYLGRLLGYGSTDLYGVATCTEQKVTVLGFGELGDGEGDEFTFPLPPSLSAVNERRRLTITLAWISPVSITRQNYRIAHLWFNPKNKIAPERLCADFRAVRRGTVQHEILEGDRAVAFQDGEAIALRINCRSDAGDIIEPIRYGFIVTLEIAEGINIPIYQEVRDRLAIRVPVQNPPF